MSSSNINTTLKFVSFFIFFTMIPRMNQTASLKLPIALLKSNDELDFSKRNSEVL